MILTARDLPEILAELRHRKLSINQVSRMSGDVHVGHMRVAVSRVQGLGDSYGWCVALRARETSSQIVIGTSCEVMSRESRVANLDISRTPGRCASDSLWGRAREQFTRRNGDRRRGYGMT